MTTANVATVRDFQHALANLERDLKLKDEALAPYIDEDGEVDTCNLAAYDEERNAAHELIAESADEVIMIARRLTLLSVSP